MALSERQKIAHLYRRAGFGATPDELSSATELGYDKSVEKLLNFEQFPDTIPALNFSENDDSDDPHPKFSVSIGQSGEQTMTNLPVPTTRDLRDMTMEERKAHFKQENEQGVKNRMVWLNRMAQTARPFQEKLALFWHGHFATSLRKVRDATLMEEQINLFRTHGAGNFETLAQEISKNPAMILWLDTQQSREEHPNENYARELMELFTLGLGHYTEKDVQETARAFTGWKTDGGVYRFAPRQHDFDEKTILGSTGNWNGEDAVRIILSQAAAPEFITRKAFVFFGNDNPDPQSIHRFSN